MKTLITATGIDDLNEVFKEKKLDILDIDIQSQETLWKKLDEDDLKNADVLVITETLEGPFSKDELIKEVVSVFPGTIFMLLTEPDDTRFHRFLRDLKITNIYTIEDDIDELVDAILFDGLVSESKEEVILEETKVEKVYIEKKILSILGFGGSGKTTITLNLAAVLKEDNYKVCVVDLNFTKPDVGLVVGLEEKGFESIKKQELTEKLVLDNITKKSKISYFTGLKDLMEIQDAHQNIKGVIKILSKHFDVLLLDCGAITDTATHLAITESNEQIFVFQNTGTHIKAVKKYLDFYNKELDISLSPKFIINKYIEELDLDKKIIEKEIIKAPVLGVIPYSTKNAQAFEKGPEINKKDLMEIKEMKGEIFKTEQSMNKKASWFKRAVLRK